jgi:8-oxo-dGTP diphosphatase
VIKLQNIIVVALKAIIIHSGKVLIIQRSAADEFGASTWEFAGGKLDFGEELEVALKREIQEEVGLDVVVNKLLYATTFKTHEYRQIVILTYFCTANSGNVKLSEEHQNYLWANKAQMLEILPKPILADMDGNGAWEYIK